MRIAYVLTFDPAINSGLWSRLVERLDNWGDRGINSDLIIACRPDSPLFQQARPRRHRLQLVTGFNPFAASFKVAKLLREQRPSLVYMRYNLPYPSMVTIADQWPTVLEVHADDTLERHYRPISYRWMSRLFRNQLLRRAKGFVFVDPELQQSRSFPRCGIPSIVLSNGIRICSKERYGGPRPRSAGPARLALLAGNAEMWQGFDKLASLAELLPQYEFHLVGPEWPLQAPEASNLRQHGYLPPSDAVTFLNSVDIGIGNLALERIHRRRPSPLKVREYIAAGLPSIIAHDDPDLDGLPGVLNLGYGFTPSHEIAARIDSFVQEWVGRTCPPELAQAVDLSSKEAARLNFLADVAARNQVGAE